MEDAAARCWVAVAVALTGERPDPPEGASWRAADAEAWMAAQGWDAAALQWRRANCQQQDLAWPASLPGEVSDGLEFARYAAMLAQVRTDLGLDGLAERVHRGPAVIGPEEARLLREVPPHSVQR